MTPREHHYVPQFYLRNFSSDGKRINLVNIKAKKYIQNSSIKHQCSRRQFYEYDEKIEPSLGLIESTVAPIIRSILTNHKLPKLYEVKHIFFGDICCRSTSQGPSFQ